MLISEFIIIFELYTSSAAVFICCIFQKPNIDPKNELKTTEIRAAKRTAPD